MNIVFLKLYITEETNDKFYNSQELGLAKALVNLHPEHRVVIILLSGGNSKSRDIIVSDKITIRVMPAKGIGHHGRLNLEVLKELKADLVHLLADNMLYAPNIISYCRSNNIKCHLYIGTMYTDSSKWYKRLISRVLMTRNIKAYKTVPVYAKTPFVQKQCEKLGICAKLAPVGIGEDKTILSEKSCEEIRDNYGLPLDKKILLFVGRLEEYKHPGDAVRLLNSMDNSYYLLVVGKGPLSGILSERISECSLDSRVTILEQVPNDQMRDIFKACDYYINFNPDEIYGMAILEAMCHECPVFAIDAPGPRFLLDEGETGFLCASITDMGDKIANINRDVEVYRSVQIKARKKVLDNFVWSRTVQYFEDF